MSGSEKRRVLVLIVAYHAEKTISSVVRRIPAHLADEYHLDVLIIDDASRDATFERGHEVSKSTDLPFSVHVLFNPVNQGYGGNQKLGYQYAIERGYDLVALVHGDGQYAPECLPELLAPLRNGEADAVFGSRMLTPTGALRGGMPLYKFVGNKILTWIENRLLRADLSEFHSGYRIYAVAALKSIPFERNSDDFHFDTEIIIQLLLAGLRIRELPIPTYYGDEICSVNGLKYAANVVRAALTARFQELGLFYDRRFHWGPERGGSVYTLKLDYLSPHRLALDAIRRGSRVLDLGCAGGSLGRVLKEQKECYVGGVDCLPLAESGLDLALVHDLDTGLPGISIAHYDFILLLDVVEHLSNPDELLDRLRWAVAPNPRAEVLVSTGNVAFIVTRLMLLLGQFNYGRRGILDLTHRRLYTFGSLRRALEQAGFTILETVGVPAPFPLAVGDNALGQLLLRVNTWLVRLWPRLFAYQIFVRVKSKPSLEMLLSTAREHSRARVGIVEAGAPAPAIQLQPTTLATRSSEGDS